MKIPKIKQRDITDCGAACLASIAAHYELQLPVARIRQLASTDKKGTNVLGMIEAAEKLGFQAKGVKGPFESLFKIPKPAIAHVIIKEVLLHYVVIYDATPKYIEVMDPGDGQVHRHTHEEFRKIWTGVLILLLPGETFQKGDKKEAMTSRFWRLVHPHRSVMIQALFGALVYTILGLSTSIYVQKIVDYVLVDGNRNLLNLMSIAMVALLLLSIFIGYTKSLFTVQTGQMIDSRLILGYYKHLLKLPQQFFDTMRVGEILSRINDAVKIRAFINDVSINLAVNFFMIVFSFALMFTYYWKLAVVILLVIPFYSIIYYITNRLNKKAERKLMENAAELESQLVESLNSVSTIKSFGLEQHANIKTEDKFYNLLQTVYKSGLNNLFSNFSTEFISRLFTIILLWVGAGFVLDSQITPGELLSFYALIGYFTGPVSSLIGMNKNIQNAMIAADRLFEIMDLERESDENKVTLTREMVGDIEF
ncbi:MAG: peptidase domain-containing ABC transporter, partial [Cyclobacteriaceae bacterium]